MADRYVIAPAHLVRHADQVYDNPQDAAVAAANLVEKDRAPRVVLRLVSEIRASDRPKVDIVQIEEVPRG